MKMNRRLYLRAIRIDTCVQSLISDFYFQSLSQRLRPQDFNSLAERKQCSLEVICRWDGAHGKAHESFLLFSSPSLSVIFDYMQK